MSSFDSVCNRSLCQDSRTRIIALRTVSSLRMVDTRDSCLCFLLRQSRVYRLQLAGVWRIVDTIATCRPLSIWAPPPLALSQKLVRCTGSRTPRHQERRSKALRVELVRLDPDKDASEGGFPPGTLCKTSATQDNIQQFAIGICCSCFRRSSSI